MRPWGLLCLCAQTIFEINSTARTLASSIMRSKRQHDRPLIEKFQRGQEEKRAAALKGQGLHTATPRPEEEEGEEENLQVTGPGQGCALALEWAREPPEEPGPGVGTWTPSPSVAPFQEVFSTVVGRKRKRSRAAEDCARKKPQPPAQRDEDFYIPYRPKDFESERG